MLAQQTHRIDRSTRAATTSRIAKLNDELRRGRGEGQVMITPGVAALSPGDQIQLLKAVQRFNEFGDDNDPYGEHDFGAVQLGGETYFWKIDCYDVSMTTASPDPGDPSVMRRVLTIMRADEY